jgi:ubiquinone/menaquinone biosynthesis C-methylase UbiE
MLSFYQGLHKTDGAYSVGTYHMESLWSSRALQSWVQGRQNLCILDVGCGKGVFLRDLVQGLERRWQVKASRVAGIDLVQSPNSHFAEISPKFEFSLHDTDGNPLPFPDHSFDFICCNHVLEHVFETENLVREFRRVLKPDGFCIISVPQHCRLGEPSGISGCRATPWVGTGHGKGDLRFSSGIFEKETRSLSPVRAHSRFYTARFAGLGRTLRFSNGWLVAAKSGFYRPNGQVGGTQHVHHAPATRLKSKAGTRSQTSIEEGILLFSTAGIANHSESKGACRKIIRCLSRVNDVRKNIPGSHARVAPQADKNNCCVRTVRRPIARAFPAIAVRLQLFRSEIRHADCPMESLFKHEWFWQRLEPATTVERSRFCGSKYKVSHRLPRITVVNACMERAKQTVAAAIKDAQRNNLNRGIDIKVIAHGLRIMRQNLLIANGSRWHNVSRVQRSSASGEDEKHPAPAGGY